MDDSDVLSRGSGVKDKQTDKLIFSQKSSSLQLKFLELSKITNTSCELKNNKIINAVQTPALFHI